RYRLPSQPCATQYQITTIQGHPLEDGRVCRRTLEHLTLLVLQKSIVDVVLGRPWLIQHAPDINWQSGEIQHWSESVCSTTVESPNVHTVVKIPPEYSDFHDVFSKEAATQLPPYRQWDCCIELIPGAKLPKGHVYPLSPPERAAMEEYIQETLKQGFIRPFLFRSQEGWWTLPRIDYHVLNQATVKFAYPLPLVLAALEELRGARIFTKLDLRSAYNLIRIRKGDEWKTTFITPTGHYEYWVMPYGLANSPSIFQDFMNEIFRDMFHQFVIIDIDDILYSRNPNEHFHHVRRVLQRLREQHLPLKAEKC
ncbi:hypothetical protein M9458_020626, partial [Cirrhinus mrigala]